MENLFFVIKNSKLSWPITIWKIKENLQLRRLFQGCKLSKCKAMDI